MQHAVIQPAGTERSAIDCNGCDSRKSLPLQSLQLDCTTLYCAGHAGSKAKG